PRVHEPGPHDDGGETGAHEERECPVGQSRGLRLELCGVVHLGELVHRLAFRSDASRPDFPPSTRPKRSTLLGSLVFPFSRGDVPEHPDLRSEQAYIDHAYERVEAIRDSNAKWRDSALRWQGGTHQAIDEREVFVRKTMERLTQLEIGDASLVFGRIDRDDRDRFYIGRLAIPDEDQEQLVVDWRAPVAEPFYRATGRHPLGLSRRRHFFCEGRRLKGIEDEGFADGEGEGELGLAGPGALLAALERARTGQ